MIIFNLLEVIATFIIELEWSAFRLVGSVMINILTWDFSESFVNIDSF